MQPTASGLPRSPSRPNPADGSPTRGEAHADDGDWLRQVLHELRTPVNAIQGFAELIREELFGPVPQDCRELADGIAADAGLILAALAALELRIEESEACPEPSSSPPPPDRG